MKLVEMIDLDRVLLHMRAENRWQAIEELVDHAVKEGAICEGCREEVIEVLCNREHQVTTGIGSGVAVPHAFCESLEETVLVMGRSEQGVDFEAIDNSLVHVIVLFVLPHSKKKGHLSLLASIGRVFQKSNVRQGIIEAETRQQILDLLYAADKESRLKVAVPRD